MYIQRTPHFQSRCKGTTFSITIVGFIHFLWLSARIKCFLWGFECEVTKLCTLFIKKILIFRLFYVPLQAKLQESLSQEIFRMPGINKILEHFKEAQLYNTIDGDLLSGDQLKGIWRGKPILFRFNQLDEEGILGVLNDMPIHIKIDVEDSRRISPQHSLLWITKYDLNEKAIQLVFLNAKAIKFVDVPIDIAYTDSFLNKQSVEPAELEEKLKNNYIFVNRIDNYHFLCIEEYDNSNFDIKGISQTLNIKIEDGKWIIQRNIKEKHMPRKTSEFCRFTIFLTQKANVVDKTKATEALRLTKQREQAGTTLMKLWSKYTELEVEKAIELQRMFGAIRFELIKHLPNKLTQVKFILTNEQREKLYSEKETLLNTSLELESIESEIFGSKRKTFKIYRFLKEYVVEMFDEDFEIRKSGTFKISTAGDETIQKRRNVAYRKLMNPKTNVVRDLLFAIEGEDALPKVVPHRHQALTKRTREFLEKNFGISDLNPNQKEAIEIALNTPDIVVIQGPPGTGKSTVIAAICDRLQEIAEKEDNDKDKLILVSAFQNDTVEHISSKVKTMGLPTIKVGKDSVSFTAETEFINQTNTYIQYQLNSLSDTLSKNILSHINHIIEILNKEENINNIQGLVDDILNNVSVDLQEDWKRHFHKEPLAPSSKLESRLHALITDPEQFFNEGGLSSIRRLLICKEFHPSDEERKWLDLDTPESPEDTPEGYFERLTSLKEKYLEQFTSVVDTTEEDLFFVESWLQRAKHDAEDSEKSLITDKNFFIGRVLSNIKNELKSSPSYIRRSIQIYAESASATNQVAGSMNMGKFSGNVQNVILEEAARSNPLDLLIPMVSATKRIILVGDHKQLPHLLEDNIAEELVSAAVGIEKQIETRENLNESLFGRIFNNLQNCHPKRTITLTEQFRMHPMIGSFISNVYYDGALTSKEGMEFSKKHGLSLSWAKDKVAVFVNVDRSCGEEKSGKSKSRKVEALRVMKLIKEILSDPASNELSIGVITFYSSQVTTICEEAVKNNLMERDNMGDYRVNPQYQYTNDGREKFRVGSVDSFQGKEFDIVILSTVRSNKFDHYDTRKAYGFLSLANRLNVAFSRAQKLLVVVGDASMFCDDGAKESVEGLYEFYTNLSADVKYGNKI